MDPVPITCASPAEPGEALRYRSAGRFLRERFGGMVYRVVVDAGFSCPNRDGTLGEHGCSFCTIDAFRPPTSRPHLSVRDQVARARGHLARRHPRAAGHLVYLQPYTNTYGPPERLARVMGEALACPGALGVVIGTRPDCLPEPILEVLAEVARRSFVAVEVGVQSTDDETLRAMDRGHDWACSARAIGELRARGIRAGAHVILGTPWESHASQLAGAARLCAAGIQAVKIHHLQVLEGSRLAEMPSAERERLPSWQAYARLVAGFLERLDPTVVIERLTASAPRRMLIAPRWGVPAAHVRAQIVAVLERRGRRQGSLWGGSDDPRARGTEASDGLSG
jgi:uncharacterized protein